MTQSFEIKQAVPEMVADIRALDVAAWGEESAATEEMIASRIRINPFGNYVAVEKGTNRIVGSVFTLIGDDKPVKTWLESTGNGAYHDVFNPYGEVLFGANLAVSPDKQGQQAGFFLFERSVNLIWVKGKKCGRMGARMPEYAKWNGLFTAEDYVHLYLAGEEIFYVKDGEIRSTEFAKIKAWREQGNKEKLILADWPVAKHGGLRQLRPLDGEVAFFCSCVVKDRPVEIAGFLPDYFPSDEDSHGHGVLLEWRNPDFE